MPNILASTEIDPPIKHEGLLLGADFGLKRIGLAIGQTLTKTARPLATLPSKHGIPNWQTLEKYLKEYNPKAIIVGIPLNMDGTIQEITEYAKEFAQALKRHYNVQVHGMDERLTTKEARAQLFERGGYQALKTQGVDEWAAVLIVESFMNLYC